MKKSEVEVGGLYVAKVGDKLVTVRIDGKGRKGGWNATNTRTGKRIRIKGARRLRGAAKRATKADAANRKKTAAATKKARSRAAGGMRKATRLSALDAAAQVLAKAGKPMRAQALIAVMAEQDLWKSPAGKTPHATLYTAMMREARDKGRESRFNKVARGQFAFHKTGT